MGGERGRAGVGGEKAAGRWGCRETGTVIRGDGGAGKRDKGPPLRGNGGKGPRGEREISGEFLPAQKRLIWEESGQVP